MPAIPRFSARETQEREGAVRTSGCTLVGRAKGAMGDAASANKTPSN